MNRWAILWRRDDGMRVVVALVATEALAQFYADRLGSRGSVEYLTVAEVEDALGLVA